jgi:tetratricopeptide (TPR) repeat protein
MKRARALLAGAAISVATLAVYAQVRDFDFIGFDDPRYIYQNDAVVAGLTWEGVAWAFTTNHLSNWHPVTWLSYMLDVEMFGVVPGALHVVNVLFHVGNALLLLAVLSRATGSLGASSFVAAFFALHPLHVESVAWIAERKDVLSTFLGFLSMGAWVGFARSDSRRDYVLCFLLLALGLMAKPMLVSFPILYLLLDYWPLRRFDPRRSVVEKLPLFALAAAASVVIYVVQEDRGSIFSPMVPLPQRIANALVSYVRYLGKAVWPVDLALFYPHPYMFGGTPWTLGEIGGATALLAAFTTLAVVLARRRPYVLVGWLWYLVTLLPVIGLVQTGWQAMADRYSYVPLIGPSLIVAFGARDGLLALGRRTVTRVTAVLAVVLLVVCAALTARQIRYWRDSLTIYSHSLAVAPGSPLVHSNLGNALWRAGRREEAIPHYEAALRIAPRFPAARRSLLHVLRAEGRYVEAMRRDLAFRGVDPESAHGQRSLGDAYVREGRLPQAIRAFERAIEVDPRYVPAYRLLGHCLRLRGDLEGAIARYREVVALEPDEPTAHADLADALIEVGDVAGAIVHYSEALALDPQSQELRGKLEAARAQQP